MTKNDESPHLKMRRSKFLLHQYLERRGSEIPKYETVSKRRGYVSTITFRIDGEVHNITELRLSRSKNMAEQASACLAYQMLRRQE